LRTVSFNSCNSSGKLKSTLAPSQLAFRIWIGLKQARPNPITSNLI
jgi:hypothetical protein